MRFTEKFLGICVLGLFWTTAAVADVSLAAFEGRWEGTAVSENNTSVNFPITSRDMDVEIRPKSDKSFTVTWRTLLRQKGEPGAPDEVLKETTRTFVPTANSKIWHTAEKTDVYQGGTITWATLKGQNLTVFSMAMNAKGGYDMLVYSRTLTGLGMKLDFKAIRDGDVRRTAKGTLIRSGQ